MGYLFRWWSVFLLMFPLLASADPLTVSASAQGTLQVDDVWYGKLTGDNSFLYSQPMPFTFTLSGEFDPDSPDFRATDSGIVKYVYQRNPVSVMTLTVGDMSYPVNGGILLALSLQPERLEVELIFTDLSHDFTMSLTFIDSARGFGGDPLSPRSLTQGGSITSFFDSIATYHTPDSPGIWSSTGYPVSASIRISAIPEPSHAGMLMAGLFVLAIARRQRAVNAAH